MDPGPGPQPQTEKEYLIEIYSCVREISARVKDQEERIERLENWRNRLLGGLSVLSAVVTILGGLVAGKLWR